MNEYADNKFTTNVSLQVIRNGEAVQTVNDSNTETLWSKLNTPVSGTLYMDFVAKPFEDLTGLPLSRINKTFFNKLTDIRSNILSLAFSLTSQTYTANITWTNTTDADITLYGLISYNSSMIYTVFDMSSAPLVVKIGDIVTGKYTITYDNATPTISNESTSHKTINANSLVSGFYHNISPNVRDYKYSRIFVKTTEYFGASTTDINFTSLINASASSSNIYKKAIGPFGAGELFYKCMLSGSPNGASVHRFINYPSYVDHNSDVIMESRVPYSIIQWPAVYSNNGHELDVRKVFSPATIKAEIPEGDEIEIKPWKITFPSIVEEARHFGASQDFDFYGDSCRNPTYNNIILHPAGTDYFQYISYLYWNAAPSLTLYIRSKIDITSTLAPKIYINGVQYSGTLTKLTNGYNNWTYNFKIDFTSALSSLPAGEGVIIVVINKAISICDNSATYSQTYSTGIASSMWGYVVPYAGMLTEGSGTIGSDWISTTFFNYTTTDEYNQPVYTDGVMENTVVIDAETAAKIGMVKNTLISTAMPLTQFQYNIWVKLSEKDKTAGVIEYNNTGLLQCARVGSSVSATNYSNAARHLYCPIYVTSNMYAHIVAFSNTNLGSNVRTPAAGYYEHMYALKYSDHIAVNSTNREVVYKTDRAFKMPTSTYKLHVCKAQGNTVYDEFIPDNFCAYSGGTASETQNGTVIVFESTWLPTETINNLVLTFTGDSIFALGEFFSLPISDSEHELITDVLEQWKLYHNRQRPFTVLDFSNENVIGATAALGNNTDTTRHIEGTGELKPVSIRIPSPDLQIGGEEYTHCLTYIVPLNENTSHVVLVPKVINEAGVEYLTNLSTIYVTDGMHVIPWTYNAAGCETFIQPADMWTHPERTQHIEELFENWVIILNQNTLSMLYNSNASVTMHVYLVAKTQEEWLPITIDTCIIKDIKTPERYMQENCMLYIRSNNTINDPVFTNTAPRYFGDRRITNTNNYVVHRTDTSATGTSSIYFNGSGQLTTKNEDINLSSYADDYTISFWINPSVIGGVNRYIFQKGYSRLFINTSGNIVWRISEYYTDYDEISYDTIKANEWTHIAVVFQPYAMAMYINGKNTASWAIRTTDLLSNQGVVADYNPYNVLTFGSTSYIGYMEDIAIFKGAIWEEEFEPPTKNWAILKPEDLYFSRNFNVIKAVLPIAVNNKIKITNLIEDEAADFCQLREWMQPIDTFRTPVIYIKYAAKANLPSKSTLIDYMTIPVAGNIYRGSEYGQYLNMVYQLPHACSIKSDTGSQAQQYISMNKKASYSYNHCYDAGYAIAYTDKFKKLGYKFHKKDSMKKKVPSLRIENDIASNTKAPETFFLEYATPIYIKNNNARSLSTYKTNKYTHIQINSTLNGLWTLSWKDTSYSKISGISSLSFEFHKQNGWFAGFTNNGGGYYDYVARTHTTNYQYYHDNPSQSTIDVLSNYWSDRPNIVINYATLHKNATPKIMKNSGIVGVLSSRNNYTSWSSCSFITNAIDNRQYTKYPYFGGYYTTGSTIIIYLNTQLIDHDYKTQDVFAFTDDRQGDSYSIYSRNVNMLSVKNKAYGEYIKTQRLSAADKFLYSTNKVNFKGDTPTLLIKNDTLIDADSFSIKSYVSNTFTSAKQIYNNEVGYFILTDKTTLTRFFVMLADRFNKAENKQAYYAYTYNPELSNLLTTGNLQIQDSELCFVSDTLRNNDEIPKNTELSSEKTSTIVFMLENYGIRHMMTASNNAKYLYYSNYTTDHRYLTDDNRTYDFSTHTYHICNNAIEKIVLDKTLAINGNYIYTGFPYFANLNTDILFANYRMNAAKWDNTRTGADSRPCWGMHYHEMFTGYNEFKTGVLDKKALYVDSRVIALSNTKFNVVFDTNQLPVQKINYIGLCTPNIYTDEYGDRTNNPLITIPVVKIINTSTHEEKIYAVDAQYFTVYECTDVIAALTDNNIVNRFINRSNTNTFSYEKFNTLLTEFNTETYYSLSFGVVVYQAEISRLVCLKSLSVYVEFNDTALYTPPKWCYFNKENAYYKNSISDIKTSVTDKKFIIYNPNNTVVTNTAVKIDCSKYALTSFVSGIIATTIGNVQLPTAYEINDAGDVSVDYYKFNKKHLWVKVNEIQPLSTIELLIVDDINEYEITDVFDFYDDFNIKNTTLWNYSWNDPTTGNESIYAGGSSISGSTYSSYRTAFACHRLPIELSEEGIKIQGEGTYNIVTKNLVNTNTMYEVKFRADNDAAVHLSIGENTNLAAGHISLPYYFASLANASEVWFKTDLQKGNNEFYVYYNSGTATNASNGTSTFLFFDNFSNTTTLSNGDLLNWYQYHTTVGTTDGTKLNLPANSCVYSFNKYYGSIGAACEQCRNAVTRGNVIAFHTSEKNFCGLSWYDATNMGMRYMHAGVGATYADSSATNQNYVNEFCYHSMDSFFFDRFASEQNKRYIWHRDAQPIYSYTHQNNTPQRIRLGGYESEGYSATAVGQMQFSWVGLFKTPDIRHAIPVYSNEETGTWTVDSHVFTKRKKVNITSYSSCPNTAMKLMSTNWGGLKNIRITGNTHYSKIEEYQNNVTLSKTFERNFIKGAHNTNAELLKYWTDTKIAGLKETLVQTKKIVPGENTFYVYYNSATADVKADSSIFELFDDFSTPYIDETKWGYRTTNGINMINSQMYVTLGNSVLSSKKYFYEPFEAFMFSYTTTNDNNYPIIGTTFASGRSHYLQVSHMWLYSLWWAGDNTQYAQAYRPGSNTTVLNSTTLTHIIASENKASGLLNAPSATSSLTTEGCSFFNNKPTISGYYRYTALPMMGNLVIGSNLQVANTTATNCYFKGIAAFSKGNDDYHMLWRETEGGSWIIDGHEFTNRRRFVLISNSVDDNVIIKVSQRAYNNQENVRFTQTNTGTAIQLREMDTTDTCVLKLHTTSNDMYCKIESERTDWKYTVEEKHIPIKTPATGFLSIQASTGSDDKAIEIEWVRARKFNDKELLHVLPESFDILIENKHTDWVLFDTTGNSTADKETIQTKVTQASERIKDPVFYDYCPEFLSQTKTSTNVFGASKRINYQG